MLPNIHYSLLFVEICLSKLQLCYRLLSEFIWKLVHNVPQVYQLRRRVLLWASIAIEQLQPIWYGVSSGRGCVTFRLDWQIQSIGTNISSFCVCSMTNAAFLASAITTAVSRTVDVGETNVAGLPSYISISHYSSKPSIGTSY